MVHACVEGVCAREGVDLHAQCEAEPPGAQTVATMQQAAQHFHRHHHERRAYSSEAESKTSETLAHPRHLLSC